LHARLGASIQSLIIRALDQVYSSPKKGAYVTGPLVTGPGKLGPAFPEDENPQISFFPDLKLAKHRTNRVGYGSIIYPPNEVIPPPRRGKIGLNTLIQELIWQTKTHPNYRLRRCLLAGTAVATTRT